MVDKIVAYESGEQTEQETVKMFQKMIEDGSVWKLQGSYGRTAMELLRAGMCVLGKTGCRDYYGNYIPSRYEVKRGTMGSVAFYRKMRKERV